MMNNLKMARDMQAAMKAGGPMAALGAMGGPPPPVREGYLTKLGYNSGKWQRRYMVLTQSSLTYMAGPGQKEKGVMFINSSSLCEEIEPAFDVGGDATSTKLRSPVPEYAFKLTTSWKGVGRRTFIMFADDQLDCTGWVSAINNLIGGGSGANAAAAAANPMAGMGGLANMMGGMGGAAPASGGGGGAAASASGGAGSSGLQYGAIPPGGTHPLPLFPGPTGMDKVKGGNMMDMMGVAASLMAVAKGHQNDPHLSQTDNAVKFGQATQNALGLTQHDEILVALLKDLEINHLPQGMAGYLVTEAPERGTLGEQHGFKEYDLIFEVEGTRLQKGCTKEDFGKAKAAAFQSKGSFALKVFNFQTRSERDIIVQMPPGKPNAILGISTSQLPLCPDSANANAVAAGDDLYVKGWFKQGNMYVTAGANAYPLNGACTTENANIYVKIYRQNSGMMIGTGEYHPLYNYSQLNEPLYVEVWRMVGTMLVQSGQKYAALPATRQ